MRFALLTLFCCALATALPREGEDEGKKWDERKGPNDGGVVKSYNGGVGGGVGVGDVGVGLGGGGGCDPVACDINCRKLGDESGYCDNQSNGLVLGILGQSMPGCICIPTTTTDCTTTTTATITFTTSTCSVTTTATNTATTTATATITNTSTTTATSTTTTTATACPTVACFCCTNQNQLGNNVLTGTCDTIPNSGSCPVGVPGRSHKVCCDGAGSCQQLT